MDDRCYICMGLVLSSLNFPPLLSYFLLSSIGHARPMTTTYKFRTTKMNTHTNAKKIINIPVFPQPIPTMRNVLKTGTVGDLPLLPYTSMVASCFVWIVYGILKREPTIYLTNIVEFFLSVYYFVEFTNYAPAASPTFPGSVYRHIQFIGGIWFTTLWVTIFFQKNISAVGDLTVLLEVLTFASPLAAVQAVLETKTSESIPWPFTLAALFNCMIWVIVGIAEMHDFYVASPAILGLIFSGLQVALKLYYGDHGPDANAYSPRAPVEMKYPVLDKVRQVVLMGNPLSSSHNDYNPLQANFVDEDSHDLHLHMDDMGAHSSNADYVEFEGGQHHHSQPGGGAHGVALPQPGQLHEIHLLKEQRLQQWSVASTGMAAPTGLAPAPAPNQHLAHKNSNFNDEEGSGMESVLLHSTTTGVPSQQPPFPLPEAFRSRSGSATHPSHHDRGL